MMGAVIVEVLGVRRVAASSETVSAQDGEKLSNDYVNVRLCDYNGATAISFREAVRAKYGRNHVQK